MSCWHVEFTEHFYTMADEECMSVILEGGGGDVV